MRTFFSDTTKIDVIAHISGDDLEAVLTTIRQLWQGGRLPMSLTEIVQLS